MLSEDNIPLTFAQVRNTCTKVRERKPCEHRLANNCYRNIKYPARFLVNVPESEKFCVLDSQTSELYLVMLPYEMALTNHLHYKAYCVGMWCHAGGRSYD